MRNGAIILTGLLLACSASKRASSSQPGVQPQLAAGGDLRDCCALCPLALPGTTLSYAESSGGGSMVFQGPDSELEELRARVRELADYHNQHRQKLAMMTVAHDARPVMTDSGARIEITTMAGNDLPALQREIENEVQWLQGGNCELAGEPCSCGIGSRQAPLSGSSPTQEPAGPGVQSVQPAGPAR